MTVGLIGASAVAQAAPTVSRSGLAGWYTPADAKTEWSKYCSGSYEDVTMAPKPNYNSTDANMKLAVAKLKTVAEASYYMYKETLVTYGLKKKVTDAEGGYKYEWTINDGALPPGVTKSAHGFLTYLCGEFRDRPSMIAEKIKWVSNIFKLPATAATQLTKDPSGKVDYSKNIWSQITAAAYQPYLSLSSQLFSAKKSKMVSDGTSEVKIGAQNVDAAVDGVTVCQTKYIFGEMVAKKVPFSTLVAFETGYAAFAKTPGNCTSADLTDYYDFRGDTNFKPNSPESNGMIWRATHMTRYCETPVKSKDETKVASAECQAYYQKPFQSRWDAARAGLGVWIFYKEGGVKDGVNFDDLFGDTQSLLVVNPKDENKNNINADKGPYRFSMELEAAPLTYADSFTGSWISGLSKNWQMSEFNFNVLAGLGSASARKEFVYKRIKDAVDRHTDWYASGYDDGRGKQMTQAYSPFVASSYEMSESNSFVNCGITVPCTPEHDDRKQWMFIFRIKKDNWYTTQRLAAGEKIDFSRMWFDETAFGTTGLADSEKAWDRLGTAMEGEYDSIVYLHNITNAGQIQDDGLGLVQ